MMHAFPRECVDTFQAAVEMYVDQVKDGEISTHDGYRTSQKMVFALFL
jgi:hypothetical protein